MRNILITVSAAAAAVLTTASPAAACSCAAPRSVDIGRFVERTPVLFWGRALREERRGPYRVYVFEVAGAKGALPARVRVRTRASSAACGVRFPLKRPVLVGGGLSKKGLVSANACTQLVIGQRRAEIERILARCRPFGGCR